MACIEEPQVKLKGIMGFEKGALVSDMSKGGCMGLAKAVAGKAGYHGKDFFGGPLSVALTYSPLDKGGAQIY